MTARLTDLAGCILRETDAAILFSDVDDPSDKRARKAWLPKSQIEIDKQRDGSVVVTLPEWLAVEKELL